MKKGFTLVELLAVIVILALIVLVVTPRVQNAINGAKESLEERSIDLYGRAALTAVNLYEVKEGVAPTSFSDIEKYIEYDGEKVECAIEKLNRDKTIFLSDCTVDGKEIDNYSYGNKTICVAVTEKLKTTGNVPQGNYTAGDEYLCEVAPGREYTFFVLSKDGDKVNLIMDSNIDLNGKPIKDYVTGTNVQWATTSYNTDGPVGAFNYLSSVTSSWTNIPNIEIDYIDVGTTASYGYGGIKTDGNETKIINKSGTVVATYTNLKARLPERSEMQSSEVGCQDSPTTPSCPLWAVNYMSQSQTNYVGRTDTNVTGYWTLSSASYLEYAAFYIHHIGYVPWYYVDNANPGVRPVITLSKNDLS